ncbi:MAG TPA: hypothetical protein PKO15_16275 [Fibrobacteria bacterium]|nr:hypothetical protein [Fibrobacteria bacterium]HOX50312.1 hypothetical protein [Fibrobacteria bacterium]
MSPRQEQLIEVIRKQPEDAGWDQLIEQILIQRMVEEGLEDVRSGNLVANEDALARIRSWH